SKVINMAEKESNRQGKAKVDKPKGPNKPND
ncbi:hypothetical protein LCGC14_2753370, partial [marine sediment metagenome]